MAEIHQLNAWRHHLDMGEKGVKKNLTNLMVHLRFLPELGSNIRFNEQSQWPEWNGRKLEDHDFIDIRLIIERAGFQPNEKDVRPAVIRVAHENSYNPVRDYLDGLKWDGKPRIDRWMHRLLGSPDDAYTSAISAKSLISAVARIIRPGCQVDTMVVLEGPQGIRKSSAIQELFTPEYAFESVTGFSPYRNFVLSILGAWCVELAEFVSVANSDVGAVKGVVSMRHDRVQLPYARSLSDLPRRIVFWGTINPGADGYLTDDTGNRRFWPVSVSKVDIEGIRAHRDQMWAEAASRYHAGEQWWLEGNENAIAEKAVSDRMQAEAWAEPLENALMREAKDGRTINSLTSNEALSLLGIPHDRKDDKALKRVAKALRELGFENKTERPPGGGKPRRIWARK